MEPGTVIIVTLTALLAAGLLVWGSASVHASFYLSMRCRAEGAGHRVALTFDDGPDPERTPAVLDLLAQRGVRATFFLVGERAETHPELVRRMVAEGHVVGNHSHTHAGLFPLSSLRNTEEELHRTTESLTRITGLRPRLFRPPLRGNEPHDCPGGAPPGSRTRRVEHPLAGHRKPRPRTRCHPYPPKAPPRSSHPAARPLRRE